jgi:hypothetical protein
MMLFLISRSHQGSLAGVEIIVQIFSTPTSSHSFPCNHWHLPSMGSASRRDYSPQEAGADRPSKCRGALFWGKRRFWEFRSLFRCCRSPIKVQLVSTPVCHGVVSSRLVSHCALLSWNSFPVKPWNVCSHNWRALKGLAVFVR